MFALAKIHSSGSCLTCLTGSHVVGDRNLGMGTPHEQNEAQDRRPAARFLGLVRLSESSQCSVVSRIVPAMSVIVPLVRPRSAKNAEDRTTPTTPVVARGHRH